MKKKNLIVSLSFFVAFLVWTVLLCIVDVKVVGPETAEVGFSAINTAFHNLTGVNMFLYDITDLLSIIPLLSVIVMAFIGLIQLIKRKSILKIDKDILALGGYYILVIALYLFFEVCVLNYRPILIEGVLEPSYPSSTTLLCLTVMPTVMLQIGRRIKKKGLAVSLNLIIGIFTAFMVISRIISGVHWITDIIGGTLLSASLLALYCSVLENIKE
ncbi:MAG: phosphatase PAP2 family protein [Clostridia bacterium]|nr:phosphatase PAP2 family protein [Clostridia bacterium]